MPTFCTPGTLSGRGSEDVGTPGIFRAAHCIGMNSGGQEKGGNGPARHASSAGKMAHALHCRRQDVFLIWRFHEHILLHQSNPHQHAVDQKPDCLPRHVYEIRRAGRRRHGAYAPLLRRACQGRGPGLSPLRPHPSIPPAHSFSRGLSIADDARLPGLTELARRVKRHGARISIQLQHGGAPRSPNFRAMPCLSYPPSPA